MTTPTLYTGIPQIAGYQAAKIASRECLKFTFMDIVQADLEEMKCIWNGHRIRANRDHANGIPDELFYLPQERGSYPVANPLLL